MNLVECTVTEVIGKPYEMCGFWCVDVKYISYGREATNTIYGLTKEEAFEVKKGYEFLS